MVPTSYKNKKNSSKKAMYETVKKKNKEVRGSN